MAARSVLCYTTRTKRYLCTGIERMTSTSGERVARVDGSLLFDKVIPCQAPYRHGMYKSV
jgi:hypothetical protein